jgi:hypothetical protein
MCDPASIARLAEMAKKAKTPAVAPLYRMERIETVDEASALAPDDSDPNAPTWHEFSDHGAPRDRRDSPPTFFGFGTTAEAEHYARLISLGRSHPPWAVRALTSDETKALRLAERDDGFIIIADEMRKLRQ